MSKYLDDDTKRLILLRVKNGESATELAAEYGVTRASIWNWKKSFAHDFERYDNIPPDVRMKIIDLLEEGKSIKDVLNAYCINYKQDAVLEEISNYYFNEVRCSRAMIEEYRQEVKRLKKVIDKLME